MKSNEIERNQTQFDDIKLNQLKLYQIKLNYIKLDDMKWDEIKLTTFGAEKKNWGINQKMRTVEYNSHWFHPGEWSNQTKHVTIRTQPINHSIKTTTIRKKKNCDFLISSSSREKKKCAPKKSRRRGNACWCVCPTLQQPCNYNDQQSAEQQHSPVPVYLLPALLSASHQTCCTTLKKPWKPPSNRARSVPARCPLGVGRNALSCPAADACRRLQRFVIRRSMQWTPPTKNSLVVFSLILSVRLYRHRCLWCIRCTIYIGQLQPTHFWQ